MKNIYPMEDIYPNTYPKNHLIVFPCTFDAGNEMVNRLHRHHVAVVGNHKFAVGCKDRDGLVHGIAICGHPVARHTDQYRIIEVLRLVTDGTFNACSILYAACARIAKEMGFNKIQTFILDDEPGISLKASGWVMKGTSEGGEWHLDRKYENRDQTTLFAGMDEPKHPVGKKQRWEKTLNPMSPIPKFQDGAPVFTKAGFTIGSGVPRNLITHGHGE